MLQTDEDKKIDRRTRNFFLVLFLFLAMLACARVSWSDEPLSRVTVARCIHWLVENVEGKNQARDNLEYRLELADGFLSAGEHFDLPVLLMVGMSYRESVFRPNETGPIGELGLMQVCKMGRRYCKEYCGAMETTKEQIDCGACWFRYGLDFCGGEITPALTVYASGKCKPRTPRIERIVKIRLRLWGMLREVAQGREPKTRKRKKKLHGEE